MDDNINPTDDLDAMFDEENTQPAEGAPAAVADAPAEPTAPEAPKPEEAPTEPPQGEPTPPAPEVQPQKPETPGAPSEPRQEEAAPAKPLTAEDVSRLLSEERAREHDEAKSLDQMEKDVLAAYYPQGLSNVLLDEKSGREIRTPQDVVELSNGTMSTEEAAQWLMNEQYKLDAKIAEIKGSARELAEVNNNFRSGATRVLDQYKPIFDKYPALQQKVYSNYMKQVKVDDKKDLVLSAPDIEDYYRDFMEPYVMAFGFSQQQVAAAAPAPPAGAPAAPAAPGAPAIPDAPRQTAADRMDVSGDGGVSDEADPSDPNDSLSKLFGE